MTVRFALFVGFLCACGSTPPSSGVVKCDVGFTACGGACVKLESDDANCGACGMACEATQACVKSACYARDCSATDCAAGQVCPMDRCVEIPCVGVTCSASQTCFAGTCVESTCGNRTCASGLVCINGQCEDASCFGVICPATAVCELGACKTATCTDGVIAATESDVDCGGTCPACPIGKVCSAAADCASATCTGGRCVAPASCSNAVKDGAESDVDCGAACRPCADGRVCVTPVDCSSGECTTGRCTSSAQCADGLKNNTETDVDCGGSCPGKCPVGKTCALPADCASGACAGTTCAQVATCTNNAKDGAETDIDCGGPTCSARCADAKSCMANRDCASGRCSAANICVAAGCADGIKNGTETGVDCGGGCPSKCPGGSACLGPADCIDAVCVLNQCVAPTCTDNVANGAEADLDCGGTCPTKCVAGKHCNTQTDCISDSCIANRCSTGPSCADGVKNQQEVDVDCGGPNCPPCANGKTCNVAKDCTNGFCMGAAGSKTCVNGFLTGVSTDITGSGTVTPWPTTGRFNGDAFADVAVTLGQSLVVSLGSASGTLSAPAYTSLGINTAGLLAGDFTGDGSDDLVAVGGAGGGVVVLRSNGDGSFQSPLASAVTNRAVRAIAIGRFDADALLDVVAGAQDTTNNSLHLLFLKGTGLGNFTSTDITIGAAMTSWDVNALAAGDLDNDGKLDVAVATRSPSRIHLFFGNGMGGFTMSGGTLTIPDGTTSSMGIGDFNNDNRNDIIVPLSSQPVYEFHEFIGSGAGSFLPPLTFALNSYCTGVFIDDYNGDGNKDFLTFGQDPLIRLGDGSGGFKNGVTPAHAPWFQFGTLAVGDFNGDGKKDMYRAGGLCCPNHQAVYIAE